MDLVKGTKVRLNTVLYPIPELIREFLSAQGDGLGSNAEPGPPARPQTRACVNAQAFAIEYSDDGRGGGRFHGIARKEPEGVGEFLHGLCIRSKRSLVVDKGRRAEIYLDLVKIFGSQKS